MQEFLKKERIWKVGGKEYTQRPLSLSSIAQLLGLFGDVLDRLYETKTFDEIKELDTDKTGDLFKLISVIFQHSPMIVYRAVAIALDAGDEDIDYLKRNMKINQVLKVAITFLKQNDVKEIKQDFLELIKTWKEMMKEEKKEIQKKKAV